MLHYFTAQKLELITRRRAAKLFKVRHILFYCIVAALSSDTRSKVRKLKSEFFNEIFERTISFEIVSDFEC